MKQFLLLAQCVLVSVCAGRDAFTQADFDSLVVELHELNERDPALALERAGPATEFVTGQDNFRNQVLLATALAPVDMRRRGVLQTRQDLVALLDPSYASPHAHELGPIVRLAISDLLSRNGEVRFAFYHASEALKAAGTETPLWIRVRILDRISRLNESALQFSEALFYMEKLKGLENFEKWINPVELGLRKSELYLRIPNERERNAALAEVSDQMSSGMDPDLVGWYWLQQAWTSLADARPDLAMEELAQAEAWLQKGQSLPLKGDALFVAAAIHQRSGSAEEEVRALLLEAEMQYRKAGFPSRYPDMLIRILHAPYGNWVAEAPSVFLKQMERFSHDESRLHHFTEGLSAAAELLRREGRMEESLSKLRLSHRYLAHFIKRIDYRQAEFARNNPERLLAMSDPWTLSVFYYILLTVSVVVIVLLLLSLKIYTQKHVNRQLALSIEKARHAEQAAEASSRLKSQFLANVSHELKTPMSGLVGMTSLLDESITDPVQRRYLKTIRTCSRNLLILINDLLDLGRIESGNLDVEQKEFNPAELVEHCLELVRNSALEKGLDLEAVVDASVPETLTGDPTRIGQVLNNLLQNAIKYTASGSVSLRVAFERAGGSAGDLLLLVEDTGIGIQAEDLHTLFEPFNRLKHSVAVETDGTGLGLAICKKLVELMSGSISVESEPGTGSRFTVKIPLKSSERAG